MGRLSIKSHKWADQGLQEALDSMHFLDVQLNIGNVDVGSCDNLHEGDLERLSSIGNNIVRGIKMAIKTLYSGDITITKPCKATALRFMLHWMGDLHQPLHNGGQRLGKLLNAIFDSQMAEQEYISLVRDINNDTRILILNLGSTILQ